MTDAIEAIKANLLYESKEEQDRAYESWFTVVAILADAYADADMMKEETICRWLVRNQKIPSRLDSGRVWWWYKNFEKDVPGSILPLTRDELITVRLYSHTILRDCLDRLLLIPDEYLGRFA